jgi:hypothetical protein
MEGADCRDALGGADGSDSFVQDNVAVDQDAVALVTSLTSTHEKTTSPWRNRKKFGNSQHQA